MKKLLALLVCLCLLPLCALAEEASIPEGYRLEDFGDFTMPIASNAVVFRHDRAAEDGYFADIYYIDVLAKDFAPYITIWWRANNMTELTKHWHPLDYAKVLRKDVVELWTEAGMIISSSDTVLSQKKGDVLTAMVTCRVEENSWFADAPHDVWLVQRQFGTYTMGTYYFEIYAQSREDAEALLADIDRVVYK